MTNKRILEPATTLRPLPVVLLSCRDTNGENNIITLAYAGIMCARPPVVTVGIRPATHSHGIICRTREFVINLPGEEHLEAIQLCGTKSGRQLDKFAASGFTPVEASRIKAPLIAECIISFECTVRHVIGAGSHDVFMAEVLAVQVDQERCDERGWPLSGEHCPVMLNLGGYYGLGESLGSR